MPKSVDEVFRRMGDLPDHKDTVRAKADLLALVLGCLPERLTVDTNPLSEDDCNDNNAAIQYNFSLDQTEQALRKVFK